VLDFRIAPGSSVLTCQIRIASIRGSGGSGRLRGSELLENPFFVRFRRLGGTSLLASRFDMERDGGTRSNYVSTKLALRGSFIHTGVKPGGQVYTIQSAFVVSLNNLVRS